MRSRVIIVAGALALLAVVLLVTRRDKDGNSGRVWSAEHGHWHDK